jgi:signal transduction histidine kinase
LALLVAGASVLADEPAPVAHWKLDETDGLAAADSASGEHQGKLWGFPGTLQQWGRGRIGGALGFNIDGQTNEVLLIPDRPDLNFTNNLAFSLCCWVRCDAQQVAGCGIICKGFGAGGEQYALDTMNGHYRFHIRDANKVTGDFMSAEVGDGRWHHLACVYDGKAGFMNVYFDARASYPAKVAFGTLLFTSDAVSIGNRQHAAGSPFDLPFKGWIDDVRIYDRALTEAEVRGLYSEAGFIGPVFYLPPRNVTQHEGENALFSASADGSGPLSLQWQFNGMNLVGQTNPTLKLINLERHDAGTYTLQLTDVRGVSTSASALLAVQLFYWHTWWFRACFALVFLLAVIITVHLLERRKARIILQDLEHRHELERERMRIARDMHDEIGGKLSRISFLSDMAGRGLPETSAAKRQVGEVSLAALDIIRTVDEIVWAINPRNDTVESLIHYLNRQAQEFFELTEVDLEFKLPADLPAWTLSAETRHSLFCAFREALNNALKHSGATRVRIEFALTRTALGVTIIDNGCGFELPPNGHSVPPVNGQRRGSGLINMRERLEGVRGACAITSRRGQGTTVVLTVDLS